MNKRDLIIYRVVTGIFTLHMLFTVFIYFYMHDMVAVVFESLGFSAAMIYPLAIAKVLGLVAIWTDKSRVLKELAYLGFVVDFILAITSHLMAGDGSAGGAIIALVFLVTSYIFHRRLAGQKEKVEMVA